MSQQPFLAIKVKISAPPGQARMVAGLALSAAL
jgi:hypothetical protein